MLSRNSREATVATAKGDGEKQKEMRSEKEERSRGQAEHVRLTSHSKNFWLHSKRN